MERSLRFALPLFGLFLTLIIAACGGSGSAIAPPVLSVSVSPGAATVQPGTTQQVTATVTGGPAAEGVTWTLSCSSIPCGSISPASTPSGTPTTYTPPVTLPASDLSAKLTATSVADATKFSSASLTIPQLPGFAGVSEAHVDTANKMARLIINGKPAPPLWFSYPQNFPDRIQFLAPEVQDASSHGISTIMVSLNSWPWDNQGTAPLDFSAPDQVIDNVLKVSPQAVLVLNIGIWPGSGWKPPVAPTTADYLLYADGHQLIDAYHASFASDIFFNGFVTSVPHLLQHYESSSYAAHILGYVINWGGTGEWFPVDIWSGPDYSPVNTQKFRTWLQSKYGTDAALSAAWGKPVTIGGAQVPAPQAGRFPMHSVLDSSSQIDAFYALPGEQDWVDYSAYVSDLVSQRILDAASAVRAGTGSKRLIGVHNGYLIETSGSFFGHFRFDRLLSSPDVDFFGGGVTPYDRLAGGAGQEGAAVDSVNAHGKLWFNENDLGVPPAMW